MSTSLMSQSHEVSEEHNKAVNNTNPKPHRKSSNVFDHSKVISKQETKIAEEREIFRKSVAELLYSSDIIVSKDAFNELVSLGETQLINLGSRLKKLSQIQRRTQPSIRDVQLLMRLTGLKPSLIESEGLRESRHRSLLEVSASLLEKLPSFNLDPQVAAFFNPPGVDISQIVPSHKYRDEYVPSWLPPYPPDHTFMATPQYSQRITDPRQLREKIVEEGRLAEEALRRLTGIVRVDESALNEYDEDEGGQNNALDDEELMDIDFDEEVAEESFNLEANHEKPAETEVAIDEDEFHQITKGELEATDLGLAIQSEAQQEPINEIENVQNDNDSNPLEAGSNNEDNKKGIEPDEKSPFSVTENDHSRSVSPLDTQEGSEHGAKIKIVQANGDKLTTENAKPHISLKLSLNLSNLNHDNATKSESGIIKRVNSEGKQITSAKMTALERSKYDPFGIKTTSRKFNVLDYVHKREKLLERRRKLQEAKEAKESTQTITSESISNIIDQEYNAALASIQRSKNKEGEKVAFIVDTGVVNWDSQRYTD